MAKSNKDVIKDKEAVVEKSTQKSANMQGTVESIATQDFNRREIGRKGLIKQYRTEAKVPISIAPFYAPYFGKVLRTSVNGIWVEIPCDGATYQINKTHAAHIKAKLRYIDKMQLRQKKAADVQNNVERSPGELHI